MINNVMATGIGLIATTASVGYAVQPTTERPATTDLQSQQIVQAERSSPLMAAASQVVGGTIGLALALGIISQIYKIPDSRPHVLLAPRGR